MSTSTAGAAAPRALEGLFNPASVAMVGASPEMVRYGGRVFRFLHAYGFDGPLWPVNPKYATVFDRPCYPSLRDLPGRPEHVGIAVGRERMMATLEECAAVGARFVTVFTAGYAENGTAEGRAEQHRLVEFVRAHGMRLLGPNCNGVINRRRRLALAGTAAVLGWDDRPAGRVAVMSQSGGAGAVNVMWRAMLAGVDVAYHASTGNEADIDILDLTEFAVDDPDIDIVLLFAERIGDGAKLARVARKAADLGKVILIHKMGRSEAGARAAVSHTGALAGSDRVHDAAFRQHGVVRVEFAQHLYEAAMLFQQKRTVQAEGVAAVSSSGGNVVLTADLGERYGIGFPMYGAQTRAELGQLVPGYINFSNPTDLSPEVIGNTTMFRRTLETLARDPAIGMLMPVVTLAPRKDIDNVLDTLAGIDKPAAIAWIGGCTDAPPPLHDHLERGIPIYRDVDSALRAADAVFRHTRFLARRRTHVAPVRPDGIDVDKARALVRGFPGKVLTERVAKQVLACYGIRVTREWLGRDRNEVIGAYLALGGTVAAKIESVDVPHKTEAGGVRLGLSSSIEVADAAEAILAAVRRHSPQARIEGVLVQEMVPAGHEMILGVSTDPTYGPVIALGTGGIFVEVMKDSSLRLPPLSLDDAQEMLDELAGARLLGAVRGRPARDRDAVADALVRLSWLACDLADDVEEIDVNPLIVGAAGSGAVAVDALIVRRMP